MKEIPLTSLEHSFAPLLLVNGNGGVKWSNSAARQILNWTNGEDRTIQDFIPSDLAQKILKVSRCELYETLISTKSQPLKQTLFVLDISSGDPDDQQFLIAFISQGSLKAEPSQREEFLSMAAHDLKNPLSAIFGYADALLDTQAGKGLLEEQREIVRRIRRTASRSIELVKNYQLLSRISTGLIQYPARSQDLNEMIENVVAHTWREDLSAPTLHIELCKEKLGVLIEPALLERVITNLFTNALKYTPAKDHIYMKTWKENEAAYFEIRNTGVFIPAERLSTLLERYAPASGGFVSGSSGLGLHIVKTILALSGGQIEVCSDEARGTVFRVWWGLV